MESGRNIFKDGLKLINRADIILITILLMSCLILFAVNITSKPAAKLKVVMAGELIGIFDLGKDQKIVISEGNILEIRNRKYRMKQSKCQKQICVKQGWCTDQPIICVPQQITITPLTITANGREKRNKQIITY